MKYNKLVKSLNSSSATFKIDYLQSVPGMSSGFLRDHQICGLAFSSCIRSGNAFYKPFLENKENNQNWRHHHDAEGHDITP